MRVIITGSRDWTDAEPVHEVLRRHSRRGQISVAFADQADGAERIARDWCLDHGVVANIYQTHSNRRSNKTPQFRDSRVLRDGADLCLVFITPGDGETNGGTARLAGIPTLEHRDGKWRAV